MVQGNLIQIRQMPNETHARRFNGSSKRSSSLAVLSSQCTSLQNSNIDFFSLNINKDDVLVITKSLSFDTFHGWDSLSFKIMKLCGKFIAYPLELIFEAFLQNRVSLSAGKKLTQYLFMKTKISEKKYRPVSLFPIFRKHFEREFFKELFNHFHKTELSTKCQYTIFRRNFCKKLILKKNVSPPTPQVHLRQ